MQQDLEEPQLLDMYTISTLHYTAVASEGLYAVSYSTMMWHPARKTAAPPKSRFKFIHGRAKMTN